LTLLILEEDSPKELFKDTFWPDQLKVIWRSDKTRSSLNSIYDNEDHGVSCKCCTRIINESITCPTKAERLVKPRRGRPKLRRSHN
jgi:hypothetical protein